MRIRMHTHKYTYAKSSSLLRKAAAENKAERGIQPPPRSAGSRVRVEKTLVRWTYSAERRRFSTTSGELRMVPVKLITTGEGAIVEFQGELVPPTGVKRRDAASGHAHFTPLAGGKCGTRLSDEWAGWFIDGSPVRPKRSPARNPAPSPGPRPARVNTQA